MRSDFKQPTRYAGDPHHSQTLKGFTVNLLLADLVWPALFLLDRIVAIPVILIGLAIEAALFRYFFQITWKRAFSAACVINLVSTLIGIVILPAWGWYWEYSVTARNRSFGWGTFNPLTWAETCLMAWLLTNVVEGIPLRMMVGPQRNLLRSLLLANLLSVGVAYLSLSFLPPRHDPWPMYEWTGDVLLPSD